MAVYKGEDAFRDTDYTVADVMALWKAGGIPEAFVTEFPDGTVQIDGILGLVMKHAPKAQAGENWLQIIGSHLHHAAKDPEIMKMVKAKSAEYIIHEGKDGEPPAAETIYYCKEELSLMMGMDPDKVHRLLHRVFTRHKECFDPWIIQDEELGYRVARPLLNHFRRQGQDFGKFLEDVVTGRLVLRKKSRK